LKATRFKHILATAQACCYRYHTTSAAVIAQKKSIDIKVITTLCISFGKICAGRYDFFVQACSFITASIYS
jgi:hypothetical protein